MSARSICRAIPVVVLLLGGCGAPLRPSEAPSPAAVRPAPAGEPRRPPPAVGRLDLEAAVGFALEHNPALAAAAHEVDAAAARTGQAAAQRWPSLRGTSGYTRHLDPQRLIPPAQIGEPVVLSENIASADAVLSVPLFTFGRIGSEIRSAELSERASRERLLRAREEVAFAVARSFFEILARRQNVAALELSKTAIDAQRRRTLDLISAHKAASVDLLRTEVRLADIEQLLVRERSGLAVEGRRLANLLGLPELNDPAGRVEGVLALAPAETDRAAVLAEAIERREDRRAALDEVEAQAQRVEAAWGSRWPSLFLRGSYGVRVAIDPSADPAGAEGAEDVGSAGVYVDVPIFEGGRLVEQEREERARLGAARERLAALENAIRLEVESALLEIDSARARAEAMSVSVEQAKESLRIEQEKYALGKGTLTDVLDAESALLGAETSRTRALADFQIALAGLRFARGGPP